MKKVKILIITCLLSISMVGCVNSIATKAAEQGKLLMANKEYDKAFASFKLAIDEGIKDKEIKTMYNIIDIYQKSNSKFEEGNIEEAKKIIDKISKEYVVYSIKDDIEELKEKININYREVDDVKVLLIKAEKLFNEKKYEECKLYIEKYILVDEGGSIGGIYFMKENQFGRALEMLEECKDRIQGVKESQKSKEYTDEDEESVYKDVFTEEELAKDKIYRQPRDEGYYVPHLDKILTLEEMCVEYDILGRPYDYIAENGCVYMFNPASAKAE